MSYRNRPSSGNRKHRLVVAITGSSGSAYGLKLLQALRGISSIEVHLVVSSSAWITIHHEVGLQENDFKQLSDFYHPYNNIGAPIASGSFSSLGMVIAPCSVNTMSSIASGLADNLITRAAHVTIKEQRKLILMIRESPLHLVHLRNMVTLSEMGCVIAPPIPCFYHNPKTIDDLIENSVGRVLNILNIDNHLAQEWAGQI